MTDAIGAGSILIEGGTPLPGSLLLQNESSSNGWAPAKDLRLTFEKHVQDAGWTFFFMAGKIKATVFGFDRQKSLGTALARLIANVKSQNYNSIEISDVVRKTFLKIPYVTVSAHSRHLQESMVLSGAR